MKKKETIETCFSLFPFYYLLPSSNSFVIAYLLESLIIIEGGWFVINEVVGEFF